MSIYGYLNCHDCCQRLWMGKALHRDNRPFACHIGGTQEAPMWARTQLNQVLWKFLADHTGHRIDVRLENVMTEEMFGYQDIGGDGECGISIEEYLADWPGLTIPHNRGRWRRLVSSRVQETANHPINLTRSRWRFTVVV